ESKDRKEVWFDTSVRAGITLSESAIEVPYTARGELQGYLKMAYILAKNELEPAYVEFKKTIDFRTSLLFVATIIVSIAFSYFMARGLSKQLTHVYRLASEVGRGKRDTTFPLKGPEEVRQ